MASETGPARRGRPRNPAIDAAIADAYVRLLSQRGREGLTREHVAAEAGVSVMAVYRRYASLEELQVAVARRPVGGGLQLAASGSARADLRAYLVDAVAALHEGAGPGTPRALAEEIAVMAGNELVRDAFSAYLAEQHDQLVALIEAGVERGEFAPHTDAEIVLDLIRGALYYRLLLRHVPIDAELVDRLIATALPIPKPSAGRTRGR